MDFAEFYKRVKGVVGSHEYVARVEVERKGIYEHLTWSACVSGLWTSSYFKPEDALKELQKRIPVRANISAVGDPNDVDFAHRG